MDETCLGDKSFAVGGPRVWNTLPLRCSRTRNHRYRLRPQICIKYSPDAVPPIHAVSSHVATDKLPSKDGGKFRSTKLAAAIFGGPLYGGGVLPDQYCPCGCAANADIPE